jgi:hypothetical protein
LRWTWAPSTSFPVIVVALTESTRGSSLATAKGMQEFTQPSPVGATVLQTNGQRLLRLAQR